MKKQLAENQIFSAFSGNVLKIIALIAMTFDHVGLMFFPEVLWMRIIGRLAFPIFAFMIAEGCCHTKKRKKYLSTLMLFAFVLQVIYYIFEKSLYMCIFVTFSLSVLTIYAFDNFKKKHNLRSFVAAILTLIGVYILTDILPEFTSFKVDYGFFGVLLPVIVYFSENKFKKILTFSFMLVLISFDLSGIQFFSLLTIPLIALYNGKRGELNLKYLFYVYYPFHMAVIYLISLVIVR